MSYGSLSTISSESMVEIRRTDHAGPSNTQSLDEKHRLVYTKSKVYVNPTAFAKDNIPGFAAIVKREAINPSYLLAWIPETLLNAQGSAEWDKFVKVEEKAPLEEEDDDVVLIDLPTQTQPESYAFSVPITSIYSLLVHAPTLSSWYGSIGINLINGNTLPTLYFHDDESRSFTIPAVVSPSANRTSISSYPPPPSPATPRGQSWGGEDLLVRLRSYAHILRSNLQPSLFLIDPSRSDIEAHTTQLFDDDAVDDILAQSSYANSHSPVPAHRRPRPLSGQPTSPNPYSHRSSVLHRSLASPSTSAQSASQARTALLQSFSNITRATRHAAQNILSHPLAKPILPHLPDPVKSLVNANGEWQWGSWVEKGGVGEFEAARVYLAKWARIVAEEGEKSRLREAQSLPVEESSSLGVFELLHSNPALPTPKTSRNPKSPIEQDAWDSWFAADGKPVIPVEEMKRQIFGRGVSPNMRQKIWPFILGIYTWDATTKERQAEWEAKKLRYEELKDEWCGAPEVFDRPDVQEERHRIDVDCRRTDRTQPLFTTPSPPTSPTSDTESISEARELSHRYSIISPHNVEIGSQSPTNAHIDRLAGILLTYNFYEKELGNEGYVQGMSDLCAPIYVVMASDEPLTFWCFVEVMDRMKQNFLRDQSGMKKQLLTLQQLINIMDPELYRHLEKTDGLNLFFCFRWILISFKREFSFDDVLRLWEVLWTNYYSAEFVLFVALAVLESHRDVIIRYLVEFDEILKYCNELSMTIELDSTLAQAEVLFLSFAQLVANIDRRRADENLPSSSAGLRRRGVLPSDTSDVLETLSVTPMPILSENLRELLKTERSAD